MYDMYSWDQATPAGGGRQMPERRPRPAHKPSTSRPNGAARPAGHQARAAQAVQVALDRRDNGGDPAGAPGQ